MVDVMIQLSAAGPGTPHSQEARLAELRQALKGVQVEPLHPGSTDPALASYYRAEVPDMNSAAKIIEMARGLPSVAAAYVKPRDELP
jgi:hypothetical protein